MKRKTTQLVLVQLAFTAVIALNSFYFWIVLGTSNCSGTGTGMNHEYLVCNEEYWLLPGFLIQFGLSLALNSLILFKVSDRKAKVLLLLVSLAIVLATNIFYNTDIFSFWWINVTGMTPSA